MLAVAFLQWWYGRGWLGAARRVQQQLGRTAQGFSLTLLLRTLFAPWKKTINIAGPNTPLQVRMQWLVGNLVARFIGLAIRSITLFVAVLLLSVIAALGLGLLLLWPVLPAAWLISLIIGIFQL